MHSRSGCALFASAVILAAFAQRSAALAHCNGESVCNCPSCPIEESYRRSRWNIIETANFKISSEVSKASATDIAKHAEALRSELVPKWLGSGTTQSWTPKCEIVLHGSRDSYVSAVGRGSERTVGSSLTKNDGPKVVLRRIDLLGNGTNFLEAALPHELTHVVLKDRFVTAHVPRWADEGTAILSDPSDKQRRHAVDLKRAISSSSTFHAAALLTLEEYPAPDRFGVFYGQSASVTEFLVRRKTPEKFIKFIEKANAVGYDSALRTCYDIASIGELDRLWRDWAALPSPSRL